jgi:hypothetical protein
MVSVRPLLFRAMYPRRHTGKKVGTCGALPRHGLLNGRSRIHVPRTPPRAAFLPEGACVMAFRPHATSRRDRRGAREPAPRISSQPPQRQVAAMVKQAKPRWVGWRRSSTMPACRAAGIAKTTDASGDEFDRVNGINLRGVVDLHEMRAPADAGATQRRDHALP